MCAININIFKISFGIIHTISSSEAYLPGGDEEQQRFDDDDGDAVADGEMVLITVL